MDRNPRQEVFPITLGHNAQRAGEQATDETVSTIATMVANEEAAYATLIPLLGRQFTTCETDVRQNGNARQAPNIVPVATGTLLRRQARFEGMVLPVDA